MQHHLREIFQHLVVLNPLHQGCSANKKGVGTHPIK